jgi:hypothetical protein
MDADSDGPFRQQEFLALGIAFGHGVADLQRRQTGTMRVVMRFGRQPAYREITVADGLDLL